MEGIPTGRINPDTGKPEFYDQGAPPMRAPAYTGSDGHVKYVLPSTLVEKALAAGIPITLTCKVAGIMAIRDAIAANSPEAKPDLTGNQPTAALARGTLGELIQARRKEMRLSRKQLHARVCRAVDDLGYLRIVGWGEAQVQQWEIGRSAPRKIDPLLRAMKVQGEEAKRWRVLWAQAKRGVDPTQYEQAPPIDPAAEREVPAEDVSGQWQAEVEEMAKVPISQPEEVEDDEDLTPIERLRRTVTPES